MCMFLLSKPAFQPSSKDSEQSDSISCTAGPRNIKCLLKLFVRPIHEKPRVMCISLDKNQMHSWGHVHFLLSGALGLKPKVFCRINPHCSKCVLPSQNECSATSLAFHCLGPFLMFIYYQLKLAFKAGYMLSSYADTGGN